MGVPVSQSCSVRSSCAVVFYLHWLIVSSYHFLVYNSFLHSFHYCGLFSQILYFPHLNFFTFLNLFQDLPYFHYFHMCVSRFCFFLISFPLCRMNLSLSFHFLILFCYFPLLFHFLSFCHFPHFFTYFPHHIKHFFQFFHYLLYSKLYYLLNYYW